MFSFKLVSDSFFNSNSDFLFANVITEVIGSFPGEASIEEKFLPRTRCQGCNFVLYKDAYTAGQWSRNDCISFCKACVANKTEQGTPFRCNNCGLWKSETAFKEAHMYEWCLSTRVCYSRVGSRLSLLLRLQSFVRSGSYRSLCHGGAS